ncbi:TonB-dependent receptor [Allopusillimonas soli]|uniref:TonB-dependent receptor n=1 Tax=Allopusillimonas soli TaxID=659016 RepID=A0A853FA85_9BURK|nr:TonB-dependent receptor [Allopusillimonas soli]NYT35840.1 TonB-dependent receptor [Allopusillimonas soli]TEA76209.1 TonB-dependent receptor [Allopusillimonas soli]
MSIFHIDARAALALAAATALSPSRAQTPPQPAVLAPVVIKSNHNPSLTAPTAHQAKTLIEHTPGGVELVPGTAWRETQATTIKDILGYTPGVFAQPKWGEDTRLSIRGSGLSRYYHLRGIALYQDGVPINNADGSADFQWIDPTAYAYTEVYKGANALRYGAGTLGGAINFVTPSGRTASPFQGRLDAGSFGWRRAQLSSGFADESIDGFITGSWQRQDGYRDHSAGDSLRVSGNLGWRLNGNAETRFYVTGVRIRQEIPGSVSREQALDDPRRAAPQNEANDWQRNIDGARVANRTVLVSGDSTYEFGAWLSQSHLHHPIYQYLDNVYTDYGAYTRLVNETPLAGHDNRLTLGLTWSAGKVDAENYVNAGGHHGARLSHTNDRSDNWTLHGENAFSITPDVSLITGLQYQHAQRKRADLFNGGQPTTRSGDKSYDFFNPKLGVLWQVDPGWQVFGNISRSAEPPTFGDMNFSTANDLDRLQPQRATTLEIGTRGQSGDLAWDLALYHARIRHELQCISSMWNICDQTTNLDRTIHQGIELGLQWTALRGLLVTSGQTDSLDLNLSYTFNDFHYDDDSTWGDNEIPGVPRHFLRAELLYRHPDGFYFGPNVEWVPQAYYVDNANSVKTQSYALLGLRAGWETGPYSFYLDARNLTDRRYIASVSITDQANAGSTLFEPGTGRAVFAGVQLRY